MNLRADDTFVEDEGWHPAAERYSAFLRRHEKTAVLFLEPGVGYSTRTAVNDKATYACINFGEAICPQEIEKQSICMDGDIGTVLNSL